MYDTLMTPLLTPALVPVPQVRVDRYSGNGSHVPTKGFFFPGPTEESSLMYASSDLTRDTSELDSLHKRASSFS